MPVSTSDSLPQINTQSALKLVQEMMAIPGKSCEEARVVEFITKRLRQAGISAEQIRHDSAHKKSGRPGGDVGNLIVKLPGTRRGPRRLLMAHVDTVPLCVGARPVRKGDFFVSRDSDTALGADNRAGASVVLNAILEIKRQRLDHPPLTLLWPVQEEIGLYGARYANLKMLGNPRLCFNWDGGIVHTVTVGATGDYNMVIDVEGIASHAGAHPEHGVSAIAIAGKAVADLVDNGWHGLVIKGKNVGTSNIGYVNAGEATNVVTPQLTIHAEGRSHDPKFRKKIRDAFRAAFERAAKSIKNDTGRTGRIRFHADLKYEAFQLPDNEPCVTVAMAAVEAVGLEPERKIANGGLDANWMTARGLPTVTIGCGQQNAHTVDEALHIPSYLNACRTGLLLAAGAV